MASGGNKKKRPVKRATPAPRAGSGTRSVSGRRRPPTGAAPTASRRLALPLLGLAVIIVAAVVVVLVSGGSGKKHTPVSASSPPSAAHCTTDDRMDVYSTDGPAVHTDSPAYKGPLGPPTNPKYTVDPPSGGDHLGQAAPPGDYEGNQVVADGYYVHSLEHGYVVIWHHPDVSAGQLTAIKAVAAKYPKDVLIVARSSMADAVAATAWHHRLLCDGVDSAALSDFVAQYRNQGPEKIPH